MARAFPAKEKYRNFDKIYQDIQKERIKAFKKYQTDVEFKKFPSKKHSVLADQKELIKIYLPNIQQI